MIGSKLRLTVALWWKCDAFPLATRLADAAVARARLPCPPQPTSTAKKRRSRPVHMLTAAAVLACDRWRTCTSRSNCSEPGEGRQQSQRQALRPPQRWRQQRHEPAAGLRRRPQRQPVGARPPEPVLLAQRRREQADALCRER